MPTILRWVHIDMDERELRNRVKNKMIRPTTIPQTLDALLEQAVAREACGWPTSSTRSSRPR